MIMGVIALIILIFIIFILFDVQNLFRAKIKLQTSVDASALTAAEWQKHTLNTVGELNLVKASSILLESDLFGIQTRAESFGVPQGENVEELYRDQERMKTEQDEALDRVRQASDTLSQMQYRALFILPLIGTGAAQQAAKNNGIPANPEYNAYVREYLARLVSGSGGLNLYENFKTDDFCSRKMYGFSWAEPYAGLVNQILYQGAGEINNSTLTGFSVMPNSVILGVPTIKSDSDPDFSSILSSKKFYESVKNDDFCALISFIDLRKKVTGTNWWGKVYAVRDDDEFICESEILPVGVRVRSSDTNQYPEGLLAQIDMDELPETLKDRISLAQTHGPQDPYTPRGRNRKDTDGRINLLPALSWAVFKDDWEDYAEDFANEWNEYLDSPLRDEAKYASGAVARMDASLRMKSVTGYLGTSGSDSPDLGRGLRNGGMGEHGSSSLSALSEAQRNLRHDAAPKTGSNALAKPFGYISCGNNREAPHHLELVLPVFRRAALIPVALEDPGLSPLADWLWYEFLLYYIPKLGEVGSLDAMPEEYKKKFAYWHNILIKASNPAWVQKVTQWLDAPVYSDGEVMQNADGTIVRKRDLCLLRNQPSGINHPSSGPGGDEYEVPSGTKRAKGPVKKY